MSFDGNGNYTVPAGTSAVTGTVIDSAKYNALLTDLQTALTKAFLRDGQSAALANLPMGGYKLTGLAAGSNANDSVRFDQLTAGSIVNTPAGSIAATTVQAALNELDTEKAPLASPTFTGTPAAPTASAGTNTTQLATTAFVLANNVPAGTIIDFAGTAAPTGFLACPTTATNISRTTYATLFTAIGTTWGAGDGSTTFGCPWFPADYAGVQANANVGTASVGVMPAHTHPLSITTVAAYDGGNAFRNFKVTGSGESTSSTGTGTENLAAGHRVLKCVKL